MKNNVLFFLFLTTIRVAMVCFFQSAHPRGVRSLNPRGALSRGVSIRAPAWGAICQKRQQSATIAFQSAHLREVRLLRGCRQSTIMTFQSAHLHEVRFFTIGIHFTILVSIRAPTQGAITTFLTVTFVSIVSIRAPTQGAIRRVIAVSAHSEVSIRAPTQGAIYARSPCRTARAVSIRAPTQGAMATQSKIRPIRGLTPPQRSQNRRILGNPSPQWHPCARPLREKRHRFYDHLWIALERFIGSSHRRLCCGCKFSVVRAKRPCFGLPRRPTKRRIRPY